MPQSNPLDIICLNRMIDHRIFKQGRNHPDMKIHIIRQRTSEKEIREMLEELETYIKLAVDVEQGILDTRRRGRVPCRLRGGSARRWKPAGRHLGC